MSDEKRTYYLDLKLCVEFEGEELPCEDTILAPIKTFIKKTMKTYQKTSRMVVIKSSIYEAGYEECFEPEGD